MNRVAIWLIALACPLAAHVGSPDVFFEGSAGAYRLLVTIRPPQVVPGVAEIEIRNASGGARQVRIVPLRMTGLAATLAPTPDLARPSKDDPNFYTGSLWLMITGAWKVRVDVDGTAGKGTVFVPVPALATRVMGMQKALGAGLLCLCGLLAFGLVSIAGAAAREAQLAGGKEPGPGERKRARIVMGLVGAIVATTLWYANGWWGAEASSYLNLVYKPLRLDAVVVASPTDARLLLTLANPGWLNRTTEDLVPDHGHLMHLYMIRMPAMDRVWHLHPERQENGSFLQQLPAMPAGRYALYGDVVHASGLAETATGEVQVANLASAPLAGDDAGGVAPALGSAASVQEVPGGLRMVWDRGREPLRARNPVSLRFRLEDATGHPASGMELYMGMQGHAAIIGADGSVFAHIHPFGSVAMPAIELAGNSNPHAGHRTGAGIPAEVSFPYGFPKAGQYRIVVQMKQAGEIVTGAFDASVEN